MWVTRSLVCYQQNTYSVTRPNWHKNGRKETLSLLLRFCFLDDAVVCEEAREKEAEGLAFPEKLIAMTWIKAAIPPAAAVTDWL